MTTDCSFGRRKSSARKLKPKIPCCTKISNKSHIKQQQQHRKKRKRILLLCRKYFNRTLKSLKLFVLQLFLMPQRDPVVVSSKYMCKSFSATPATAIYFNFFRLLPLFFFFFYLAKLEKSLSSFLLSAFVYYLISLSLEFTEEDTILDFAT